LPLFKCIKTEAPLRSTYAELLESKENCVRDFKKLLGLDTDMDFFMVTKRVIMTIIVLRVWASLASSATSAARRQQTWMISVTSRQLSSIRR